MSENIKGLFIGGPFDGQIRECGGRRCEVPFTEPVPLEPYRAPRQFTPLKVERYYAHEMRVDGESFFLFGPERLSPREVFNSLYLGYHDAIPIQQQYEKENERLRNIIYRRNDEIQRLREQVYGLKTELADKIIEGQS